MSDYGGTRVVNRGGLLFGELYVWSSDDGAVFAERIAFSSLLREIASTVSGQNQRRTRAGPHGDKFVKRKANTVQLASGTTRTPLIHQVEPQLILASMVYSIPQKTCFTTKRAPHASYSQRESRFLAAQF